MNIYASVLGETKRFNFTVVERPSQTWLIRRTVYYVFVLSNNSGRRNLKSLQTCSHSLSHNCGDNIQYTKSRKVSTHKSL